MAVQDVKELVDQIKAELKNKLDENGTKFQEIEAKLTELGDKLKERQGGLLPGLEEETKKRKPSWVQIARGLKWGEWGDGYEKSILEEATKKYKSVRRSWGEARAMGTETDTAGGYLVPSEMMTDLIEKLDAMAVTLKAGARLIPGMTSSPIEWPKITGGATAYWIGEGTAITPSDLTFGQLNMVPHRLACLSKLSERLLRMGVPGVDQTIEDDFAKRLALKLDLAVLTGDGALGSPVGVLNSSGVVDTNLGTNGAVLDWDGLIDMIGAVEDENANLDDPSAALITNPVVLRILKKQRAASDSGDIAPYGGTYIKPPVLSDAALAQDLGYNIFKTTQLVKTLSKGTSSALTYAFFGVWSEVLVPQWFGMTLRASDQTSDAFEKSQVWLKMEMEVDVGVRHGESFTKSDEVATTDPVA